MSTTPETPADIYYVARDDEYLRRLQAEADYWDDPPPVSLLEVDVPRVTRYMNERFTGHERLPWYESLPRYGTFRRGCALGAGSVDHEARILEMNPGLHMTFVDISGESLEKRERTLGPRFPGRVATEQADLNFIELPKGAFDLIVSEACLHHVLNLEHVAFQVNRALTADGTFFLFDYVGEARFRFTPEKKRAFETAFGQAADPHGLRRYWWPVWPDEEQRDDFSPFEAVRPDETLGIFRRYLVERTLRPALAIVWLMFWLRLTTPPYTTRLGSIKRRLLGRRPGELPWVMNTIAPSLIPLDREVSESGALRPTAAFVVYTKRGAT